MTEPQAAKATRAKKRRRAPSGSGSTRKKKAPEAVKIPASPPPTHTLIIDNGGDTIKCGWMTDESPRIVPNETARLSYQLTVLVGDELQKVQNPNSLIDRTRSTERGIITNLGNQTQVWKRVLDLLGVIIPQNSEAAEALGWKAAAARKKNKAVAVEQTIPSHSVAVLLLIPPQYPRLLLDQIMHIWIEDFGVSRVGFGISSVCAAQEHEAYKTCCTVDLGWSSSLIVPSFKHRPISPKTIRRLPIGGRHMVNMLKYYMSYRQYNLMDQEFLLREVFESLAYLSLDLPKDLKLARYTPLGRRHYDRDFVLPDYQNTHKGQVRIPYALQKELERGNMPDDEDTDEDDEDEDFNEDARSDDMEKDEDATDQGDDGDNESNNNTKKNQESSENEGTSDDDEDENPALKRQRLLKERAEEERRRREQAEEEQALRVSLERFAVPEVLFRPLDAGLQKDLIGLGQAVLQAINACPEPYHAALFQNIYLTGGLSQIPYLNVRLERELRSLAPPEYTVVIKTEKENPTLGAWLGAKRMFQDISYLKWSVGKDQWHLSGKRKAYSSLLLDNGGFYV